MDTDAALRDHLSRLLGWGEAHVTFEAAVKDFPAEARGVRPPGFAHSAWELLEHMRFTQRDILDFCLSDRYTLPNWPADYWPPDPVPPSPGAWDAAVAAFLADRDGVRRLATDPATDLLGKIPRPRGEGQAYLREVLLVADHNAYHLGQLVAVRQALGIWPPS